MTYITLQNIAFAKGGAHLPIAHTLCLPEPEIIVWGGVFFCGLGIFGGAGIILGRRIFFSRVVHSDSAVEGGDLSHFLKEKNMFLKS